MHSTSKTFPCGPCFVYSPHVFEQGSSHSKSSQDSRNHTLLQRLKLDPHRDPSVQRRGLTCEMHSKLCGDEVQESYSQ